MKMISINRLLIMAMIHFALMFTLMYAMVDVLSNVYPNLNQVYMASVMTAPMIYLEILLMGSMYENKKAINLIMVMSLAIFTVAFFFIRQQTAISDKEFLKSMIPHHAGALLMCQKAELKDSEIKKLCENILKSQQSEIDWMKQKLQSY